MAYGTEIIWEEYSGVNPNDFAKRGWVAGPDGRVYQGTHPTAPIAPAPTAPAPIAPPTQGVTPTPAPPQSTPINVGGAPAALPRKKYRHINDDLPTNLGYLAERPAQYALADKSNYAPVKPITNQSSPLAGALRATGGPANGGT